MGWRETRSLPKDSSAVELVKFFDLPSNHPMGNPVVDLYMDLKTKKCSGHGYLLLPDDLAHLAISKDGSLFLGQKITVMEVRNTKNRNMRKGTTSILHQHGNSLIKKEPMPESTAPLPKPAMKTDPKTAKRKSLSVEAETNAKQSHVNSDVNSSCEAKKNGNGQVSNSGAGDLIKKDKSADLVLPSFMSFGNIKRKDKVKFEVDCQILPSCPSENHEIFVESISRLHDDGEDEKMVCDQETAGKDIGQTQSNTKVVGALHEGHVSEAATDQTEESQRSNVTAVPKSPATPCRDENHEMTDKSHIPCTPATKTLLGTGPMTEVTAGSDSVTLRHGVEIPHVHMGHCRSMVISQGSPNNTEIRPSDTAVKPKISRSCYVSDDGLNFRCDLRPFSGQCERTPNALTSTANTGPGPCSRNTEAGPNTPLLSASAVYNLALQPTQTYESHCQNDWLQLQMVKTEPNVAESLQRSPRPQTPVPEKVHEPIPMLYPEPVYPEPPVTPAPFVDSTLSPTAKPFSPVSVEHQFPSPLLRMPMNFLPNSAVISKAVVVRAPQCPPVFRMDVPLKPSPVKLAASPLFRPQFLQGPASNFTPNIPVGLAPRHVPPPTPSHSLVIGQAEMQQQPIKAQYDMVDIAAILTHPKFRHDLDKVITRAVCAGVKKIILPGMDLRSCREAVQLASCYSDNVFFLAGIHPHNASSWTVNTEAELHHLLAHPRCVGIGECGLDWNRNFTKREHQVPVFEEQIKMACRFKKPLLVHNRDATDDVLSLLGHYLEHLPHVVIHCFTGDRDDLRKCLAMGFCIGLTGTVLRDVGMQRMLRNGDIPLHRLMLETDSPFMYPSLEKSKLPTDELTQLTEPSKDVLKQISFERNEPGSLPLIVEAVAACLKMTPREVANATNQTAHRFFNLN